MTYCYRCPECGATEESDTRDWMMWCACQPVVTEADGSASRELVEMVRDYRAEAVVVGVIR